MLPPKQAPVKQTPRFQLADDDDGGDTYGQVQIFSGTEEEDLVHPLRYVRGLVSPSMRQHTPCSVYRNRWS